MVASCPARGRNESDGAARPISRRHALHSASGRRILRARVVAALPGAAPLYAAVHFRSIAAELVGTGPQAALVVEGEVANMSSDDKPVPLIELQRCRRERRWWFASHPTATASSRARRPSSSG
jgi:hypothetical protein